MPSPETIEVAETTTLRRIGRLAAAVGAVAAIPFVAAGRWADIVALTVAMALCIVGFRSLEGVVRSLRAEADGRPSAGSGRRFAIRAAIFLVALTIIITLGSRYTLAVIAGFSTIPVAFIAEAGLRLAGLGAERDD